MTENTQQTETTTEQANLPTLEEIIASVQMVVSATSDLKNRVKAQIERGETVDVANVLVKEILPLQEMLGKSVLSVLNTIEDDDGEDFDEDGEDFYDDGEEDGDEDGDEDPNAKYDDGGEEGSFIELEEAVFDNALVILRAHGFDIPNGSKDANVKALASPEYARSAMLALLYSAYDEETYATSVQQLIQSFPNVPLQKEIDDAVKALQAAQGGGANTGGKA